MNSDRPICVLLAAVGGQGGGVLGDWLVEAARIAGYPAQATSIPGVAQRTGATTYYFELYPDREPPAAPVFTLFPDPGDVDLVAALEPTEAGRALERGFVTQGTTVITATDRIYSTAEKTVAGDGRTAIGAILDGIQQAAGRVIRFGAWPGQSLNAVLLGAVAGSAVLPLAPDDFRAAIRARGVAVRDNLAGFEQGLQLARRPGPTVTTDPATRCEPVPPILEPALAMAKLPEPLRPLVGHALARLLDYQDAAYAARYLRRLAPVVEAAVPAGDAEHRLVATVARRLAAWMSYEDVMRVAQLKTRPGRLARIRTEVGAGAGEPVEVVEFLKPGREELLALVPRALRGWLPGTGRLEAGMPLRIRTSSPSGYAALKVLAWLRRVRPHSPVFALEQAAIDAWLGAVVTAAGRSYSLACATAELSVWVRGYGQVRARGRSALETRFGDWARRVESDPEGLEAEVRASIEAARNDPDAGCSTAAQPA